MRPDSPQPETGNSIRHEWIDVRFSVTRFHLRCVDSLEECADCLGALQETRGEARFGGVCRSPAWSRLPDPQIEPDRLLGAAIHLDRGHMPAWLRVSPIAISQAAASTVLLI